MDMKEIIERINDIEHKLLSLPAGSITTKKIKGKDYYYHRITRNKQRSETYVPFEEVEELRAKIEERKALEKELKKLRTLTSPPLSVREETFVYDEGLYVRVGEQLMKMAAPVKDYKKRECYTQLYNYVFGEHQDKVFILYGLRRTGKTTLIRQVLLDMTPEQLNRTAFIQVKARDTLSAINKELARLERQGYQYVFIDEVTLMKDFIEGAALFSDIYASSGMKIVLSGTDSLGFVFTENEQLYDRCILLHTTIIPYREFENVLGIKGIDEYIKYGGTMSMSGIDYNSNTSFSTNKSTEEYIDSAIAKNIQHSLQYYQDGGHFRHLYSLYEKGELTNVINRVVEDINHRFTKEVLTRTFKSNDLAISARNLLHDRENPVDIEDHIDINKVTSSIMEMLDIIDIEHQLIDLEDLHARQIKDYLELLDLISEIDVNYLPNANQGDKITVISQPGLRYAQADALIKSLLKNEKFNELSITDIKAVQDRILSEIKGRMMEDIILLETKIAKPDKEVFKLQFAVGEFDMVVFDPATLSCEIYEVKHSKTRVDEQYKHLINMDKCKATEHRYGTITGKYVLYRGETTGVGNIKYINVEEYLNNL